LEKIAPANTTSAAMAAFLKDFAGNGYTAMDDDFNSPILIAQLFEAVKYINLLAENRETVDENMLKEFQKTLNAFAFEILGLMEEGDTGNNNMTGQLVQIIIDLRNNAKAGKDFATSDKIRERLKDAGIILKDGKNGTEWMKE
jgi:cysteinyl-tRNA synthetase